MRILLRAALVATTLSAWGMSHADFTFTPSFDHLSAYNDTSNLYISGTNYQFEFLHNGTDSLYIDGIDFTGDTADLNLATSFLGYADPNALDYDHGSNPSQYTYNWGDAITGFQAWRFNQVATIFGATTASVGDHTFTMNIMGRVDSGDETILASLDYVLTVAPMLDVTATGQTDPSSISVGQTSHLMMTVKNNMGAEFVSTTWFTSPMENGNGSNLDGAFDWGVNESGWFNRTILSGDSLTLGHSFWTANATTPDGIYSGYQGVVGGLYEGDWHFVAIDPKPEINVQAVPGPSTLISMGFGWVLLALRRKRNG
jgi:hypothetical protein